MAHRLPYLAPAAVARYTNAVMAGNKPFTAFPRSEDLLARLEKEPLVPLYLFYGEEPYLIDQAMARVQRRMGKAVATRTFYAGEDALDTLLDAWGTPSLFATQSVVVLKSAERLKAAERERLAKEADWRDATQPLILCAHGRVDLTQKFFERCAKTGFAAEFRPPFANQVPAWAQRFARERHVRLTEEAAALLADLIGSDLYALASELDKLAAFVLPQNEIDTNAVTACAGDLNAPSVFDFADALGQRDRQRALQLLRQVLADERGALPVLQSLVSHFRRLWQVKELLAGGTPENQIERVIGLRGMRLRTLISQSRSFSVSDLRNLFHRAAELDLTFKSTRLSPQALFDALVLEVCDRTA